MDFRTFKEQLLTRVRDARPDLTLEEEIITKSNGTTYNGIIVRGRTLAPVINVDAFYERYKDMNDLSTCVDEVCDILAEHGMPEGLNINPEEVTNYAKAKAFIYPRLVPKTERYLSFPHTEVADLLLVYGIRMFANKEGFGEGLVTQDLFNTWNVSLEQMAESARINLECDDYEEMEMGPMTAITNKYKSKGAAMALHSGVSIKYKDYYVIPSSIDEVIMVPKEIFDDVEELREHIYEINRTSVPENDRLSDNLYEYRNGKLEVVV